MWAWLGSHVSGVLAAYAAILSTITGTVQVWNYRRDRVRIKVSAQNKMLLLPDPRYENRKLIVVTVANLGRRPATISVIGGYRKYPSDPFVLTDTKPSLPYELTEGKNLIGIIPEDQLDFSTVTWWSASDAVGNQYFSSGTWYKRWRYFRKWKHHKSGGAGGSRTHQ